MRISTCTSSSMMMSTMTMIGLMTDIHSASAGLLPHSHTHSSRSSSHHHPSRRLLHHGEFVFIPHPPPPNYVVGTFEDFDLYHFRFLAFSCHEKRRAGNLTMINNNTTTAYHHHHHNSSYADDVYTSDQDHLKIVKPGNFDIQFYHDCCHPRLKTTKLSEIQVRCQLDGPSLIKSYQAIYNSTHTLSKQDQDQAKKNLTMGKPVIISRDSVHALIPESGRSSQSPPTPKQIHAILSAVHAFNSTETGKTILNSIFLGSRNITSTPRTEVDQAIVGLGGAQDKKDTDGDWKAKLDAEAKAKADADAKAQSDADAKAKADADWKAKSDAEAKAKADADWKAKSDAEAKAKADADWKAQSDAEAKAKADADAKAKADADAKAQSDADAKAKADAAWKAQSDAQAKAKADADAKAKADADAKAKADAASKAKSDAAAPSDSSYGNGGGGGSGLSGVSQVYGSDGSAKATFFYQGGAAGACGTANSDDTPLVALPTSMYSNGAHCGKSVMIRNKNTGKSVVAKVMDMCPGCPSQNSLDLSTGAFNQIGTPDQGVLPIEWGFLS